MITSCCGCLSLRQGTIGFAIYTMVLGVIELIIDGIALRGVQILEEAYPDNDGIYRVTKIIIGITIAITVLWIIFAVLLIAGTNKKSRGMLLPWMIMTGILAVLLIISVIRLIASGLAFSSAESIVRLIASIVIVIVDIYALMVVQAFYKAGCEEVGGQSV